MIYSNVSGDFIMPPLKYITLFNSRLICLAANPSVFLTYSISPFSTIWLLLLLVVLPDQTHQMSLVFGLSLALIHSDICPSHA